jgi:hypothetical protein
MTSSAVRRGSKVGSFIRGLQHGHYIRAILPAVGVAVAHEDIVASLE